MIDRIPPAVEREKLQNLHPFSKETQSEVSEKLNLFIKERNFDTFSFMFELLEKARDGQRSLIETYRDLTIDSTELVHKYGGSNCAGLSLAFQEILDDIRVDSVLIPSFGRYMPTPEADDYTGVRTTGLALQSESGAYYTIQPGLTIDQLIKIEAGNAFESLATRYRVQNVTDEGFHLLALKPDGQLIDRSFHLRAFTNADTSLQRNLLRTRTKYQITNQQHNSKNRLSYYFIGGIFKIDIPEEKISLKMKSDEFCAFIDSNGGILIDAFRSNRLEENLKHFIENRTKIAQELLLPSLKRKVEQYEDLL